MLTSNLIACPINHIKIYHKNRSESQVSIHESGDIFFNIEQDNEQQEECYNFDIQLF